MGRPAAQARGEGGLEPGGLLVWRSRDLCLPFDLLLTSWVEASLPHPEGYVQHPCPEGRQFSATLSLLHAEDEGGGRPGWWRITQKDVQCVLAGLASPESLRWSEHSKTELGLGEYMTRESRRGLGGRNYHVEFTSGDMGCLCQLAGNAFKCHLYCYLNLNDMLIKG